MPSLGRKEVVIGCSGFPEARAYYFQEFHSVEVQQTFYEPPRPETVVRWRTEAGPFFRFALKAWQAITHESSSPTYRRMRTPLPEKVHSRLGSFRPTEEVDAAWERTARVACAMKAEIVLFQCPASFRPTRENVANLTSFFERVQRYGLQFAWEPRGQWPPEQIASLCRDLRLVHAVDPFVTMPFSGRVCYFRLHGIGGARYHYTEGNLQQLAEWLKGRSAYVYFNNLTMLEDARRLRERVSSGAG